MWDVSALVGDGIVATNTEQQQGSLDFWFDPIPTEFFEVGPVSKPTVQLFVNDLKAVCDSPDPSNPAASCYFMYNSSITPQISSITPSTAQPLFSRAQLAIVGLNFGTDAALISISVGDAPCVISSITDTSIDCTLGEGAAGTYNLTLLHTSLGLASSSGVAALELGFRVDTVGPLQGSVAGGSLLSITGAGFSRVPASNNVRVGEALCTVVTATPNSIACRVPPLTYQGSYAFANLPYNQDRMIVMPNNDTIPLSLFANVTFGSYSHSTQYQYDWALTPYISAVSPQQVSSGRTTTMGFDVVLPLAFTASSVKVSIGSSICQDPVLSATRVSCVFPRGLVPPILEQVVRNPDVLLTSSTGTQARAHVTPGNSVQFALRVTSISSLSASIAGGTILTST